MRANLIPKKERGKVASDRFERLSDGKFLAVACALIPVGIASGIFVSNPILKTLLVLATMGPMAYFMVVGAISMARINGLFSGAALGMGVGALCFVVFGMGVMLPLRDLLFGIDRAAGKTETYRRTYKGVLTKTKSSGNLSVGDRCDFAMRLEDRLFGEMLQLRLACGGRGLYGLEEDMGWIAESTKREGEVVYALDQWDDEGDPGIELSMDKGTVAYWDQSGMRLTVALEGLPAGPNGVPRPVVDIGSLPAEQVQPESVDAAGALAHGVSETCRPGVVCWGKRMDVSF